MARRRTVFPVFRTASLPLSCCPGPTATAARTLCFVPARMLSVGWPFRARPLHAQCIRAGPMLLSACQILFPTCVLCLQGPAASCKASLPSSRPPFPTALPRLHHVVLFPSPRFMMLLAPKLPAGPLLPPPAPAIAEPGCAASVAAFDSINIDVAHPKPVAPWPSSCFIHRSRITQGCPCQPAPVAGRPQPSLR